jgi:NAD(P)-dependent dehydrogenase (short-subunit alcohol dehydrogenase family)
MKPAPLTLITGASRGIGAATARLLAARGHDLALNYARDAASAQALEAELRAVHPGQRFLALQADVADEAQVLAMFTRIDAALGRLSGLVNNAGIVVPAQRLAQMDMARWQRLVAVNVFGTLLCSREAASAKVAAEEAAVAKAAAEQAAADLALTATLLCLQLTRGLFNVSRRGATGGAKPKADSYR